MGYNFEEYCKDYKNIENFYKAKTDNFVGWCCHHRKCAEAKKGNQNAKGHSLSEESKKKLSEAARINSTGRHWYHNDKDNFFCYECPPGCELGMLKRK